MLIACDAPPRGVHVVGESFAIREGDPLPERSPYLHDGELDLRAARGETLGIQVVHGASPAVLAIPDARVRRFGVQTVRVRHASTAMYGTGGRGTGWYRDELVDDPTGDVDYFEIEVPRDAAPGMHDGVLLADGLPFVVHLDVARATLPPLGVGVWAEYDPRELGGTLLAPSGAERACVAMFRARGVMLAPAMPLGAWPFRSWLLGDAPYVPVDLGDPAEVPAWIALTRGTGKLPIAIPIDEPHGAAARRRVRALGERVRAAGGGPGRFLFAVTDEARPDYGDVASPTDAGRAAAPQAMRSVIDVYVTLNPRAGDWSYNGAPPHAGSMVVDGASPGTRTWGWIAWRYHLPFWYVWQALYWRDKYNHRELPPRPLDAHADARSYDDGDDAGNLDGVLALPGCHPTLRLEALRRGLQDRELLELAARCDPAQTDAIARSMIPRALGEASGEAAWPTDEAAWEAARRRLLDLAGCAVR